MNELILQLGAMSRLMEEYYRKIEERVQHTKMTAHSGFEWSRWWGASSLYHWSLDWTGSFEQLQAMSDDELLALEIIRLEIIAAAYMLIPDSDRILLCSGNPLCIKYAFGKPFEGHPPPRIRCRGCPLEALRLPPGTCVPGLRKYRSIHQYGLIMRGNRRRRKEDLAGIREQIDVLQKIREDPSLIPF